MIRRLLVLLFIIGVGWLIGRIFGALRNPASRAAGGDPQRLRADGTMVRDRVCNTFLPRASAITERVDGEERFFCSEKCRQTFLASSGTPADLA